jgi:hypothetical protein
MRWAWQRLGAGIREIEEQNNDMQLQTANQKRLHASLESLLVRGRSLSYLGPHTVRLTTVYVHACAGQGALALPPRVVQVLTALSGLDTPDGIRAATDATAALDHALQLAAAKGRMQRILLACVGHEHGCNSRARTALAGMNAVRERTAELETLRQRFATRLVSHLEALLEAEVRRFTTQTPYQPYAPTLRVCVRAFMGLCVVGEMPGGCVCSGQVAAVAPGRAAAAWARGHPAKAAAL